jgi:hypothetical protein
MAVHVEIGNCADHLDLFTHPAGHPERELAPLTKWLGITIALHVGIHEITADNETEVYARLIMLQGIYGPFMNDGQGNDYPFTMADVRRHRGMRVNASPTSRTKFVNHMWTVALDMAKERAWALDRQSEPITAA